MDHPSSMPEWVAFDAIDPVSDIRVIPMVVAIRKFQLVVLIIVTVIIIIQTTRSSIRAQVVAGYARAISDTNKSKETSPKPQL
jgi:hypothetical protein